MHFEYYRFFLTPVSQGELPFEERKSRQQWIEKIFTEGETYKFVYRGTDHGFRIQKIIDKKAVARLGKSTEKKIVASPEEEFKEDLVTDWPGSHVIVNLDDEKNTGKTEEFGQVMVVQKNSQVFRNINNVLQYLAEEINKKINGYYLSINPITQKKETFWSVVDAHKGDIKRVTFTYTPPNIFNLKNTLEDDLREANKEFNTTSTNVSLENNDGNLALSKDNEFLKQSAEYTDKGAGNYTIHLKNEKKIIKSENQIKTKKIEVTELNISTNDTSLCQKLINCIFPVDKND